MTRHAPATPPETTARMGANGDAVAACEPCWNEAYRLSRMLGGSQVDRYLALLEVLDNHPHTTTTDPEES